MTSFADFQRRIFALLEVGDFDEAEGQVDVVVELGNAAAATVWEMPESLIPLLCSMLYNNIGMHKLGAGTAIFKRTRDKAALQEWTRGAQACHIKALDRFDMAAEDILYLPADSPLNKNFIFTLWGLGLTSYFLDEFDAARRYLTICLRIPPEDEQAAAWQSDASNYLHRVEKEPAQVVLQVQSMQPIPDQPQLWRVQGKLLGWDAYARPVLESYTVYVDPLDRARLTRVSTGPTVQWEGRTLVLQTGPSCDLFAPLRIVEIH